jgi:hypothetical protein
MMQKGIIFVFVIMILFIGCAAMQIKQYETVANNVIAYINAGDFESLSSLTNVPFLLDGEIIMLEKDMEDFWKNITAAGFKIREVVKMENLGVNENSFKQFAETMDVKSYFKNYVSSEAVLILLETETARFIFLLDMKEKDKKIMGFKGPNAL